MNAINCTPMTKNKISSCSKLWRILRVDSILTGTANLQWCNITENCFYIIQISTYFLKACSLHQIYFYVHSAFACTNNKIYNTLAQISLPVPPSENFHKFLFSHIETKLEGAHIKFKKILGAHSKFKKVHEVINKITINALIWRTERNFCDNWDFCNVLHWKSISFFHAKLTIFLQPEAKITVSLKWLKEETLNSELR